MRFTRALVLTLCVGTCGLWGAERWATLEAIHQLENPGNSTRPGPFGELGAYQFRSGTWRMHTEVPFERANDRQISDTVAVRHYEYLKRGLEAKRVRATPYNIALAWNSGLGAVIAGTSPRVAHNYATRAANLVSAFAATAPGKTETPVLPAARPAGIVFVGLEDSAERAPTVSFAWSGAKASATRMLDLSLAFRGSMRVSSTE